MFSISFLSNCVQANVTSGSGSGSSSSSGNFPATAAASATCLLIPNSVGFSFKLAYKITL